MPDAQATTAVEAATAVHDVTKLIYSYAERIDEGDFAGVAEVFEHATLTFEGFGDDGISGREAIEKLYTNTTRRYDDGTPRTKHVMTNVIVDVADGAHASSRSYFTVLQAVPGELALQPVIAGRYRHTYERVDGNWRVATMHIIIDLTGELGHHMLIDLQP